MFEQQLEERARAAEDALKAQKEQKTQRQPSVFEQFIAPYKNEQEIIDEVREQRDNDPRYIELQRFFSETENPDLYHALEKIWESWGIKEKKDPMDSFFDQPVPFKKSKLSVDIAYSLDKKLKIERLSFHPARVANAKQVIEEMLHHGGTLTFNVDGLITHRYGGIFTPCRIEKTRKEQEYKNRHEHPKSRLFELRMFYKGETPVIELFPNHRKSPYHKVFHDQEKFLEYIAGQLVNEEGSIAREPVLAATEYYYADYDRNPDSPDSIIFDYATAKAIVDLEQKHGKRNTP
jgi:hypothetical protein